MRRTTLIGLVASVDRHLGDRRVAARRVNVRNPAQWLTAAAIALLTACGPSANPAAHLTPTSAANATASPTSAPTPSGSPLTGVCDPTHRCFALVTLRGSDTIVVRDVTDIDHPKTVGALAPVSQPEFASGSALSYVDYEAGQLVRISFDGSSKVVVASDQFAGYVTWANDASRVVYLAADSSSQMAVHEVSGTTNRVFATVPAIPGVGCESLSSCPIDVWDVRLSYSPDGKYVSFISSVVKPSFRVWSSDGTLLRSSDLTSESMSVWSGSGLFFRDANGVEVWRDGITSPFLAGVAWIRPKASPAGGLIVYSSRDALHWSHSYVVDTLTGKVRDLGRAHADPVFLNSRYVWYRDERACLPTDGCPAGVAGVPSGSTQIFDLVTGLAFPSVITDVYDVWPHAA